MGTTIGDRYEIAKELSKDGGFGDTYLAEDPNLPHNRQCVVKFLKPNIEGLEESEAQERFRKEAVTLQTLGTHSQIPQLLAYYAESFCLVQEYIEGESFKDEIPKLKGKEDSVREMLVDILHILKFVHDKGTIHRDIKPDNLIRRKSDGKFVLIDFGAVKQELTGITASTQTSSSGRTVAVQTIAIGTPGYIPLEQNAGIPQYNSDIYALGIMGIQALTGMAPDTLQQRLGGGDLVQKICQEANVSCSRRLAKILQKMVHYSYRERYQSAKAVLQDLETNSKLQLLGWAVAAIGLASVILITIPSVRLALLNSKAESFLEREEYGKALEIYNQMLKIRPRAAYPRFKRGYPLSKLKRFEEQRKTCERAITLQTKFLVEALNCKALALFNLGQYEEAIEVYDEALAIEPEAVDVLNNKGEAQSKTGDFKAALTTIERAIRINSNPGNDDYAIDNRRHSLYLKGNILFQMKEYENAEKAYSEAIEIHPNYSPSWNGRGNAKRLLKRYQEAIKDYETAIEINNEYYEAYYGMALAHEQLGECQEAEEALQKAIEIKPNYEAAKDKLNKIQGKCV